MVIHSDWGDWLPRAIEAAEPDGVDLWFLGCNGFALKGRDGTTLFIDPYLGHGDPPRTVRMIPVPFAPEDVSIADALLVTHEHTDHVHGETQGPLLSRTGATMYGPDDSLAIPREERWEDRWKITPEQFVEVDEGTSVEVGEFEIHVETAHDPDASHPVSYVIEHGSGTFFHGGDTKPGADLAQIGQRYDIDLGVVALGSIGILPDKQTHEPTRTCWYADENEVIEVASALQLDRLLPTHWDMWKGMTADPSALRHHVRSFQHPQRLEIVEIGDRIQLHNP